MTHALTRQQDNSGHIRHRCEHTSAMHQRHPKDRSWLATAWPLGLSLTILSCMRPHTHNTTLPTLTPNALINLPALSIRHSPLVAPHTVHQISSSPYQHSGTRPPFLQSVSPSLPVLASARPLHSFHPPPTLTQHSCPPSTAASHPPINLGHLYQEHRLVAISPRNTPQRAPDSLTTLSISH